MPLAPASATDTCAQRIVQITIEMREECELSTSQLLVLGFLSLAWLSLIVLLAIAPEIYDQSLRLASDGNPRPAELLFLVALSAFIVLVAAGVVCRWRWVFWLLLVAFLSGILRVPASVLELAGWIPAGGPSWYEVFQALSVSTPSASTT